MVVGEDGAVVSGEAGGMGGLGIEAMLGCWVWASIGRVAGG